MEKTNFDQLLQRYLDGTATDAEKRKIEAWLEIRKTKNATDLELSEQEQEMLFQKIVSQEDNIREIEAFLPNRKTSLTYRTLGIAASIILLIAATAGLWKLDLLPFNSGTAAMEKIILNDGTLVWLRPGSKLSYQERKSEGIRYSILQGEALFEVAKDPAHPFIIECNKVKIRVTGTSFSVNSVENSVVLSVLTGTVHISDGTGGVEAVANEKVVYTPSAAFQKSTLSTNETIAITGGTEYKMVFDNAPMTEVISRIEAKFDVDIDDKVQNLKQCRITADFTDQSLETTLQMISEVLDLDFKKQEGSIILSGKSCL